MSESKVSTQMGEGYPELIFENGWTREQLLEALELLLPNHSMIVLNLVSNTDFTNQLYALFTSSGKTGRLIDRTGGKFNTTFLVKGEQIHESGLQLLQMLLNSTGIFSRVVINKFSSVGKT